MNEWHLEDYENTICHMYICQGGGLVTLKSNVLHLVLLENTKYEA